MAATKDEHTTSSEGRAETHSKPTVTRRKSSSEDAPREDLKGYLRASRVGEIKVTHTSGATLAETEERKEQRLKDASKPGDDDYDAHKDPLIPTSTLAEIIATEVRGFGKSPTWDGLYEAEKLRQKRYKAMAEAQSLGMAS